MYDFAKLRIPRPRYRRHLRHHALLCWHPRTPADGHAPINCTHIAKWGAWTFCGNSVEVKEIRGSFHQHYHGGTNWQPYTFAQLVATVNDLCDALGLFAGDLRIVNLEIGINVRPPVPAVDLLPLFLFHRTQLPERMKDTDRGIVFRHPGRYRLKAYDKGHQYPEAGELFRFEVHVDRMAMLNRLGIRTMQDLTKPAALEAARSFLLQRFDEVFIVEPWVEMERLRPAQRALVDHATDPTYWKALTPKKRYCKRARVEGIYQRHASRHLKAELRACISEATQLAIEGAPELVGGDERRARDEAEENADPLGVTFDATRARAWANTRVVRHHLLGVRATSCPARSRSSLPRIAL